MATSNLNNPCMQTSLEAIFFMIFIDVFVQLDFLISYQKMTLKSDQRVGTTLIVLKVFLL